METIEPSSSIATPDTFPPPFIAVWQHRHILDLDDFTQEEIELVLETADAMAEVLTREVKKVPTLRGKTVVTLFLSLIHI